MFRWLFPDAFTYWRVISENKNAVLVTIMKCAYQHRPAEELGLFWWFQSEDSEFVYVPAVWERDEYGNIRTANRNTSDIASVVAYERNQKRECSYSCKRPFNERFQINHRFTEAEATAYSALLRQANHITRGTEDFDDTIFAEKVKPKLNIFS